MAAPPRLSDLIRERARAFEQYAAWAADHPARVSAGAGLEAIGAIYELLPRASRSRPVDPAGVMTLHKTLGALAR